MPHSPNPIAPTVLRLLDKIPAHSLTRFHAFATCGSFEAAASELGVCSGNILRSVTTLQEATGLKLYQRCGRNSVLTPAGESLADDIAPLLSGLAHSLAAATLA